MQHKQMKEAETLIRAIKSELEVLYPFLREWTIVFDNSKRRAGLCKMTERQISFSRSHLRNNSIETINDTILHEFSHAIAFKLHRDTGHGYYWKKIAKQLGATPKAKGTFKIDDAPWLLVHQCTKTSELNPVAKRFRRNKRIKNFFLIGRPDTKGELYFIDQSDFRLFEQGLIDRHCLQLIQ
jgi:predicted SprT family Zn-dependent metalloprotease